MFVPEVDQGGRLVHVELLCRGLVVHLDKVDAELVGLVVDFLEHLEDRLALETILVI